MTVRFNRRSVLIVLVALMLPAFAAAQTTLGRVAGTVLDESGGVLPGATVTLTNTGTGQVLSTVTTETGAFLFPQVPVGTYRIVVQLEGFKSAEFTNVTVAPGQEYSLTAKLGIGGLDEVVTVTAGASLVQTTTPEVSTTVLQQQVLNIPLANRDITNLINLQAGVPAITARANTAINGGRPTWTQVTLDGINIQDNFIRTNSLDFLPNRPTSDNVAEFAITTSVAGAENAGGTSSVRMVTPSGTNRYTGSVFYANRDNRFAANTFFNNASELPKAELSRNEYGGRVGGPIQRDKTFFFFTYEGRRQSQQPARNMTIPANADWYNGVFRYVDLSGNVQSVNVMQLTGLPVDPVAQSQILSLVPNPSNVNNFDAGNSSANRILNTAGYRFLQDDKNRRDSFTGRLDYTLTTNHRLEGVFSYFKETDDRDDLDQVTQRPLVYTSSDPKRLALAWRWAPSSRFNNEVRGGFNLAPVAFNTDFDFSSGILYNTLVFSNPRSNFQAQGRYTDTYQLNNSASYVTGNHQMQMGGSWQRTRVNPYNFAGQFPTVSFGFNTNTPQSVRLSAGQFPGGISAADLSAAESQAAMLGGIISSVTQTFQIRDRSSGFVPGVPSNEFYTLDNINLFMQDNWRWKPNFTVRAGLKWEYYSPLSEDDNLGFVPLLEGRSFEQAMLDPNTRVGFLNGPYYNKDLNNFGPNLGFAWDLTRDGRTAVRGGYSLTFVNEETVTVGRSVGRSNAGLSTPSTLSNQFVPLASGAPTLPIPAFQTERTLPDQMALSTQGILWGIDPNIKNPYVHQVSVGIQRELPWSLAAEARYVGTFGREIWRGIDYNQIDYSQEYFQDFLRARQNLFNTGAVAFNPANPASQQLTVLPTLGIALNNATLVNAVQQGEPGRLADLYMTGLGNETLRRQARGIFYAGGNPAIYSSNAIINGGFTDYNAMQLELRRQFRNGFFAQVNYTFADTKSDSDGTGQNRFEALLDNRRPGLTVGRSNFHVTHVLNGNAIYELPFGQGRRWLNSGGVMDRVFGGWQISGILALQSGEPFSIYSGRGTFNRVGRSDCATISRCNTAVSNMSVDEIQKLIGVYKQPDGRIYWIDPKFLHTTGRAVGPDRLDNSASFDGQIFFNPAPGEVGNLPVMAFDGPRLFRMDLALTKRTRIYDRYEFQFTAEAFNLTNSVSFNMAADRDINSVNFGRLTGVDVGSRVIQLSARFNF